MLWMISQDWGFVAMIQYFILNYLKIMYFILFL
jgi:hypothetical protein